MTCHLGSFGTVNLIKNTKDGRMYAEKVILLAKPQDEICALRELNLLKNNRHPFIIHLHDAFFISKPR